MNLTSNAQDVLERRYLAKDDNHEVIETPEDMFMRVAMHVGKAEEEENRPLWTMDFYNAMTSQEFIPNSPTLMNAGKGKGTLSACFVLPVGDSMHDIMIAAYAGAMTQKFGGGTGYSVSDIRAIGSPIQSTHGVACGAMRVLHHLNEVSKLVTQGGKREGANMGVMQVDHPEIMEFIDAKRGEEIDSGMFHVNDLINFNISVGITHEFMSALETDSAYELIDPHSGPTGDRLMARKVWERITENAWRTGDPGLIFLDTINSSRSNPVPDVYGPIKATNPCGEKPMHAWDSCVLGHVNLSKCYKSSDDKYILDEEKVARLVTLGVRFLDNVITVNDYPDIAGYDTSPIKSMSESLRRIGLGVLGFADLLYRLNIIYGSQESLDFVHYLGGFIQDTADKASAKLGKERGSFPLFDRSIYKRLGFHYDHLRNAVRTTIAPTGTTSLIFDASPGIEPNYALAFIRQHRLERNIETATNEPVRMLQVNPIFKETMERLRIDEEKQWTIIEKICTGISLKDADEDRLFPQAALDVFVTAEQIEPLNHVRMQSAWQAHTDDGVSKTVNLPSTASADEIGLVYKEAYESDCYGITVYRDGSRAMQVYTKSNEKTPKSTTKQNGRRKLPRDTSARRHKFTIANQKGYINVSEYEDGTPGEIFITLSKQGSTLAGLTSTVAILISRLLQYGDDVSDLARHLNGMKFEPFGLTDNPDLPTATSLVDYIARWLQREYGNKHLTKAEIRVSSGGVCPDCNAGTYYAEGCETCNHCGWGKCG